eukprot:10691468-Heterocapsa_arctica.AAC.1
MPSCRCAILPLLVHLLGPKNAEQRSLSPPYAGIVGGLLRACLERHAELHTQVRLRVHGQFLRLGGVVAEEPALLLREWEHQVGEGFAIALE